MDVGTPRQTADRLAQAIYIHGRAAYVHGVVPGTVGVFSGCIAVYVGIAGGTRAPE